MNHEIHVVKSTYQYLGSLIFFIPVLISSLNIRKLETFFCYLNHMFYILNGIRQQAQVILALSLHQGLKVQY